jgi:segregation and condensation protein B
LDAFGIGWCQDSIVIGLRQQVLNRFIFGPSNHSWETCVSENESGENPTEPIEVPAALQEVADVDPFEELTAGAMEEGEELEIQEESSFKPSLEQLFLSLLFVSNDLVTLKLAREILGDAEMTVRQLEKLARSLDMSLEEQGSPFTVAGLANGYRLRTRPEYYPLLRPLFKEQQARRLSQAAVETLAVIAYKQPMTKAEIEAIRGVAADGALKKLLEKRLITVSGRSDQPGRALTYGTTREFLEYFGIRKVPDDLPRLAEFEDLVQSKALLPQMRQGELFQAEQEN